MKITRNGFSSIVEIDLQTRRDGNSAALVAKDSNTEVYFGGLHAAVTLHDLHVCVTMNPDKGEWHNLEWARRKTLDAILAPDVIVEVFVAMFDANRQIGKEEGRRELQKQLASLLGVRLSS